jgi:hypothetical protein
MFEHKKANHREHNALYYIGKLREVREAALLLFQKTFAPKYDAASASAHFRYLLSGESLWISCNHVTPLNNWRKYGIAAPEISILLLKINGLRVFVLVTAKAAFALKMSMLLPLNKPTK